MSKRNFNGRIANSETGGHHKPAANFVRTNKCKNQNFGQKSTFWSKIDILVKNRHFGQKSTFWSKIKILVNNRNFGPK